MSHIEIPTLDSAPAESKPILEGLKAQLGFAPNLFRLMAISPNVLMGVTSLQASLGKTLGVKVRDGIALAVTQVNECGYCNAAHSFVATNFAKLSPEEIALNRQGKSSDPKKAAALVFAKKVIELRGHTSAPDFADVRKAGYSDAEIVEIIALAMQFTLTNILNNVVGTEIDFPSVDEVLVNQAV
jgi:uncharacterized peroxidase-related enzyme